MGLMIYSLNKSQVHWSCCKMLFNCSEAETSEVCMCSWISEILVSSAAGLDVFLYHTQLFLVLRFWPVLVVRSRVWMMFIIGWSQDCFVSVSVCLPSQPYWTWERKARCKVCFISGSASHNHSRRCRLLLIRLTCSYFSS